MPSLLEQLQELPDSWGLVVCDGKKRPYQPNWQNNPLTKAQVADEIRSGRAQAVGVIAGPTSGGLLFLDHDGISATAELERLGIPPRSIPPSPTCTSGRDGRFQVLLSIPEQFWPNLKNRRVFDTGAIDADGKAENLDLRWNRHQSIVIGAHPITGSYRWLRGRSPAQREVAQAPMALIELLLNDPQPIAPLLAQPPAPRAALPPPPQGAIPFLDFITRDSRQLVESGGTPGQWNDDQLRLALDLKGTESWLIAQGQHPDISARDAFALHISSARTKSRDFDERKAWARFHGADALTPNPATPLDKLLSRLAFHTRTTRPLLPPATAAAQTAATDIDPAFQPQHQIPSLSKPTKLEAGELLIMLRAQAKAGRIRFNTFSQLIELDGNVLEGSERFYLSLAEQGFKCSKELSLDCLVQVAREHLYDPVLEYLEHVEATVAPTYIDSLATTYLRPEDHVPGMQPTLYDHMIRCTLIAAVRRVMEPGCKHDTACVLMGDQGARKSSFWGALGGAFFSDALGDISSKDDLMVLHRSWIMEWAEIDHIMGRRQAGQVKAFLSQATDLFRPPYAKATESHPRRGIIVGSTNRSTGFLVDDTGNRRFWVVPTTRTEAEPIDTATLAIERDGIWAAAVKAYRNNEPSYLPAHLAQQVATENEGYQLENPWKPAIADFLASPNAAGLQITSELLLLQAVQKPTERQTRADQMQVAQVMRELGYGKVRKSLNGTLRWVFVKD